MVLKNMKEKQFLWNIEGILGERLNGYYDDPEMFPKMTKQEMIDYAMEDVYHIKRSASGCVTLERPEICKDLRFIGKNRMYEILTEIIEKEFIEMLLED